MSDCSFLLLAYYYPPMKAVGTLRMYHLSRELIGKGYSVAVITTRNAHKLQQEKVMMPEGILVRRARTIDYRSIRVKESRLVHFNETAKQNWLGRLTVRALNSFPFNVIFGEGGMIYTMHAYHLACRLIKARDITHVISSFRPYSDHLVGYLLKRKFPQLHWTADFRDIQVDIIKQNVLLPGLQHWFNKKCLRPANLVTTVSLGCKEELIPYHNKVEVLYNGVSHIEDIRHPLREKFTLSYTGSLYGNLRNPSCVFEALRSLIDARQINREHLEICYAGKDSDQWRQWIVHYQLEDVFIELGLVSTGDARNLQAESHLNLLLTFAHQDLKGALTAKFFEYLAAARPILGIVNGARDAEIDQLVELHQAGQVFVTDELIPEMVKDFIYAYYNSWLEGDYKVFEITSPHINDILWSRRIDQFLTLLHATEVRPDHITEDLVKHERI